MNVNKIRKDFPMLSKSDRPARRSYEASESVGWVYLDNAATSHKPQQVIDAITTFYSHHYATVHRALYESGEFATTLYEAVRDKVATFINAAHRDEIIFTKGTTEGINFVASTWALQHLKPGDQIVLTKAEHHANLLPWQRVCQHTGAQLVFIPINPETYQVQNPLSYITEKTKLVAVTHSSNVLGDIWQLEQLEQVISKAHSVGAKVLIDAAQTAAHQKIDVQPLGADFLVFSGHKIFGPTGIGVLYIKKELHEEIEPYQLGGSMVFQVWFDKATWAPSPHKFEAGTPPIAQAIGLGATIDYIQTNIDFTALKKHEAHLCTLILSGLEKIDGITIVGNKQALEKNGHLVSFAVKDLHPHDVAAQLGNKNIAVRAGHHCAQPLVTHLGFQSLLRVSVAAYNTEQDIEIFLDELKKSVEALKKIIK